MPAFRDVEGVAAGIIRHELQQSRQQLLQDQFPEGFDPKAPKVQKARKQIEEATRVAQLTDVERELIIRFLLNDGRVVLGGSPISAPP